MVLRRVRDHASRHNWFAAAIDLLIVMIGVFLGTQASEWSQDQAERRDARENRAMLIDDLRANQQNLAMRRHYYLWVRGEALKTLVALDRPPSALGAQFLVDSYQASQILPWSLKRNTYDQIIAGGHFAQIGDAVLRDRISNYYVGADVTGMNLVTEPPYREVLRRVMPYAAQAQVRAACGEKITENARGEPVMILPGACSIKLDPAALRRAIMQVRGAPGLALDLNRLLVGLDQKIVSVDVIARRADILRHRLEQAA
jgi:hypothetical protein